MATHLHFVNNINFNYHSISQQRFKNNTTHTVSRHTNDRNEIIMNNNHQSIQQPQSMNHKHNHININNNPMYLTSGNDRTNTDISLQTVIKNGTKLTEPLIKNLIYKILIALLPLHSQNKVHRNINPSNIICASNTTQIRLIGFNLSKHINPDTYYNDSLKITPYHSPESFDIRSGNHLKKSDIWSIGCILFELFTGLPLVGGDCEWGWKGNIMMSRFNIFPTDVAKKISDQSMDLLNKLLNPNPNERISIQQALKHIWFKNTPVIKLNNIYKLTQSNNIQILVPKAPIFAFNNVNNQIFSQKPQVDEIKTELIINNLPPINENMLLLLFSPYGLLKECKIISDLQTYEYGFVKYNNALSAKSALNMLNGYEFNGKRLQISFALP